MTEFNDKPFFERSDAFIDLGNSYAATVAPSPVSLSMIHAASRFHASVWAAAASSKAEMENRRAQALEYFLHHSRQMFERQYDEYIRNYDSYTQHLHDTPSQGS